MATTGLGEFKKDTKSHFSLKDKKKMWIAASLFSLVVIGVVTSVFLMSGTSHFKSLVSSVDSLGAWISSFGEGDEASGEVAKKDEVDGMAPPGAAPDLNIPGSNTKAVPKVLAERRPPPGTPESTRTAVAAAAKASTAAPADAKTNVAASAASATVVAGASASVTADIATLKKEVADINKWKEDQSRVTLDLARDVGEMKKASASAEISALAARLTKQERTTKSLTKGQQILRRDHDEMVTRNASFEGQVFSAIRQNAHARASGDLQHKGVMPGSPATSFPVTDAGVHKGRMDCMSPCVK